jgi:hypothetical protein
MIFNVNVRCGKWALNISCFQFEFNNLVHNHFTHANSNIHINHVSSLDKRNFFYYRTLYSIGINVVRSQTRPNFMCSCKQLT